MNSHEVDRQYLAAEAKFNVEQLIADFNFADERDSFRTFTVDVRDDLFVVRTDAEYADFDNPRGEILGTVFYLRAVNPSGYTRTYYGFESGEQAMNAFILQIVPSVEKWSAGRPVYGSIAYQLEGTEYFDMEEERMEA